MKKVVIVLVGILLLTVSVVGGVIYVNKKTEEKKYLEEYEMIQKVAVEHIIENYPSTKEIEFSPVFVDRTTLGTVNVRYVIKITNTDEKQLLTFPISRRKVFDYKNDTQDKIEKSVGRWIDSTFEMRNFDEKIDSYDSDSYTKLDEYNSAPKYDGKVKIKYDNKISGPAWEDKEW